MLETAYISLSLLMLFLLYFGQFRVNKIIDNSEKKAAVKPIQIFLPVFIWLIYILVLTSTNLLYSFDLPPRLPLFIFIPLFIICIIFYQKNKNNTSFSFVPIKWIIAIQSFRIIVEIILLYTFYKGIIPVEATFEGYNFDIVIGISALLIILFKSSKILEYKTLFIAWNILGILLVTFVGFIIGSMAYFPNLWGYDAPQVLLSFVQFPFILIAGFLAPMAIFLHVVTLIVIRTKNK